ncbi:4-phosphoerythronate dehydrogenase [Legionella hackeliae]|uniref:Erythronate-4-phosphate dehydrogenase n=1 Tax=Legionella hackeliae TaxID=449 RepID=A0A0A8UVV8_LEGHA|nr:4-phosphoerythronate dehydrogenase [Legionella hackeliae]KTD15418.1 erythronate-4-phosphate dehydrogenase [Legionella hackeliae]CEK11212.1 Erythronate-4-phosphate dehydrogenase [Legionella hackeliae]STX47978.1 erythronate-4-phosphate dehydrogenase [Legionella hackeliae]
MKILADSTLPGLVAAFPKPFELTLYEDVNDLPELLKNQQVLICRSTLKVNDGLLKNSALRYVATASSGTDHIDADYLHSRGIELIDAKGSNATAVADYVIASLAFLKKFKGLSPTKAAVIGVGEVGSKVLKRLQAVGLDVLSYDPPKAKQSANFVSCALDALSECDLISIHANLHSTMPHPSFNLINDTLLKKLKPRCAVINASRGGIVNEREILKHESLIYCTDVYSNEPAINEEIIHFATLCTPHIAGHSLEAKDEAIFMLSRKLHTAYGLSIPKFSIPTSSQASRWTVDQTWEDYILSLYNPMFETEILKNADKLEATFLRLRKAHHHRHDFAVSAKESTTNKSYLGILGIEG